MKAYRLELPFLLPELVLVWITHLFQLYPKLPPARVLTSEMIVLLPSVKVYPLELPFLLPEIQNPSQDLASRETFLPLSMRFPLLMLRSLLPEPLLF